MDQKKLKELFSEFTETQAKVLLSKNNDYADEDALSNFKRAGDICGIGAEKQCLSLIAVKVARLGVLTSGKTPENESIHDSVLDLANYAFLLHAILKDKEDGSSVSGR